VQWSAIGINGRFAPATSMIAKGTTFRNGSIQSGNLQIWVRWWRTVALHSNEPWWWTLGSIGPRRHSKPRPQLVAEIARFLIFQTRFKLLALVVQIPMNGHSRFGLPLEESIKQ